MITAHLYMTCSKKITYEKSFLTAHETLRLYKDSMYSFGKSVKNEDLNGLSVEEFLTKYNNDEDEGITLIQYKKTKPISEKGNYEWLVSSW